MRDVRAGPAPPLGELVAELPDVSRELACGQRRRRAGGQMLNGHATGQDRAARKLGRVLARVDGHAVIQAGQGLCQRCHRRRTGVCVRVPRGGQRAAVLSDEGDPHHDASSVVAVARRNWGVRISKEKRHTLRYATTA